LRVGTRAAAGFCKVGVVCEEDRIMKHHRGSNLSSEQKSLSFSLDRRGNS
jgi:hypothetical protein